MRKQKELENEILEALNNYDDARKRAAEMIEMPGMLEAITDELKTMGFTVEDES